MSSTFYDNFKKCQMRCKRFQIYKKIALNRVCPSPGLIYFSWVRQAMQNSAYCSQIHLHLPTAKHISLWLVEISPVDSEVSMSLSFIYSFKEYLMNSLYASHCFKSWECNSKKTDKNVCLHCVYTLWEESESKQNKYVHDACGWRKINFKKVFRKYETEKTFQKIWSVLHKNVHM